jgi:hypothetical protein
LCLAACRSLHLCSGHTFWDQFVVDSQAGDLSMIDFSAQVVCNCRCRVLLVFGAVQASNTYTLSIKMRRWYTTFLCSVMAVPSVRWCPPLPFTPLVYSSTAYPARCCFMQTMTWVLLFLNSSYRSPLFSTASELVSVMLAKPTALVRRNDDFLSVQVLDLPSESLHFNPTLPAQL